MCKVSTEALGSMPGATLYGWREGGEGGERGGKEEDNRGMGWVEKAKE